MLAELLERRLAARRSLPRPQPASGAPRRPAAEEPRQTRSRRREPKPTASRCREPAPDGWDVEIVTFQEHRGWRPRYVNGAEVKDWLAGLAGA